MKEVSLKRIIGNVVQELEISNVNNYIDNFARWAVDAELKIGSNLSYRHIECELDVKNNRAPLPNGIVQLNKLKIGNKHIEFTNKTFKEFYKGTDYSTKILEEISVPTSEICPDACNLQGIPQVYRVHFGGTFAENDVISLTFTTQNCGQTASNTFTYSVQAADDIPAIMTALALQINSVADLGYIAVVSNGYISIEAVSYQINIQITPYTDSILGTVTSQLYQKRVIPKEQTTTKQRGKHPMSGSENLADPEASPLNTGMLAHSNYEFFNDGSDVSVTKFAISNSCIHINNSGIEKVGISYEGVKLDCDGWPLISETHEVAVTQYLIFKYQQKRFRSGKLQNYIYQEEKMEWFRLCSQARGDANLPNEAEMEYHANMWNQLIPPINKENF